MKRTFIAMTLSLALGLSSFAPVVPVNAATEQPGAGAVAQAETLTATGSDSVGTEGEEDNRVQLSSENFPDDNFRQFLTDEFDTDGDGWVNIEDVTDINCNKKQISSLKGIELFSKLNRLYCDENNLTSLDVSKNKNLWAMSCQWNSIKSLDVSNNTKLTVLLCGDNEITNIDLSENTKLEQLYIYRNNLVSLDVSKNTKLRTLMCHQCNLSNLDISNNKELEMLYCLDNNLDVLDVSNNTKLTRI